jgi:hypothetical protein
MGYPASGYHWALKRAQHIFTWFLANQSDISYTSNYLKQIDMLDNALNFLSTQKVILYHALIVTGFMSGILIGIHLCMGLAKYYADPWEKGLLSISCLGDGSADLPVTGKCKEPVPQETKVAIASASSGISQASDEEKGRLRGQYQEVRERMKHHLSVLKLFCVTSYTTILMTGFLGAVAAIMLLFITIDGWKTSNQYVRNLFLIATVSATFCAAFPSLFQQQRNIDENKRLYLAYVALTNEICTYATTGAANNDKVLTPKLFIRSVDQELKALNNIAVGFDASKLPDFTSAVQRAVPTGPTTTSKDSIEKPASPKSPRQSTKP